MSTEPTRIIGYVTTAVTALIGLLVAFGVDISDEQKNALLTAIGAFVPVAIVMVELIRNFVVSPASAGEAVAIAKTEHPDTATIPDVRVANYRAAVVDNLPATVDERTIKWRPKVANA